MPLPIKQWILYALSIGIFMIELGSFWRSRSKPYIYLLRVYHNLIDLTNVNIAIDCVLLQAISIGIHMANNKSNSKAHSKILHISSANISLMVSNRPMLNDNVVFINYHQRHHQSSRALSVRISRFDRDPFSMQMFLYLHDPRRGVALFTVNGQFKCPRPKFASALVTGSTFSCLRLPESSPCGSRHHAYLLSFNLDDWVRYSWSLYVSPIDPPWRSSSTGQTSSRRQTVNKQKSNKISRSHLTALVLVSRDCSVPISRRSAEFAVLWLEPV